MTDEERDLIQRFVAQVGGHPAAPSGFLQGSVPATAASPDLPPVDPEADRFIGEQFARYPEARYRITQMAFVQQAALSEAQNRLRRMEWELNQARQGQQGQAQPEQHGLFSRLLGGGGAARPQAADPGQGRAYAQQSAPSPGYQPGPPPPQYPPNYQPGMFQNSAGGSGFLGSALRTATGVAGGVLAADAISSMFHGGGGMAGGFGGGFGGGETVNETVNNYGDAAAPGGTADPWGGSGQDYQASDPGAGIDPGQADPFGGAGGNFDQGDGGDAGGFDGGGGGWDDQSS